MEEEEEGRKQAKEKYLSPNLILTSNLVEEEEVVERARKMMTSKLAKCFSSNKRETEGM